MSWSVTEIEALATKAARGAGAPAGQAAQFGRALVRHMRANRAEATLLRALEALPDGPIIDLPCTIEAALVDDTKCIATNSDDLLQSYLEALPFAVEIDPASGKLVIDHTAPPSNRTGRITEFSETISSDGANRANSGLSRISVMGST